MFSTWDFANWQPGVSCELSASDKVSLHRGCCAFCIFYPFSSSVQKNAGSGEVTNVGFARPFASESRPRCQFLVVGDGRNLLHPMTEVG